MKLQSRLLSAVVVLAVGVTCLVSCQTYRTRKVEFKNHPIALYVVNEVVDEETIEYSAKFRNVGREILSFDYTIADEEGVPHVDAEGPNSGLVENLYPGAEVKVENPTNNMTIFVTLGKVTYGKRPKEELSTIYAPGQFSGTEGLGSMPMDGGLLPMPASPNPAVPGI